MPYYRHRFTQLDYEAARARVSAGPLNEYSYLGEEGQLRGALGEIAFELWLQHFGATHTYANTTKYDYEIDTISLPIKVDVKTKARNHFLNPTFEGSIPDYISEFQEYDYAVFVNLIFGNGPDDRAKFSHVQIGGFVNQQIMQGKSYFQEAGIDNFGELGNKCKFDCHNIRFGDMIDPMDWALEYLVKHR